MCRLAFALGLATALLGLSKSAHASFDLVLVLDQNSRSVHRYDGDTGTYLGRIQISTSTTMRNMGVDQANNRVYVSDSLGLHAYNYNTGAHQFSVFASTSVSDIAFRPNGTLIRGSTGSSVLFELTSQNGSGAWVATTTSFPISANLVGVAAESDTVASAITSAGRYFRASSSSVLNDFSFPAGTYADLNARGNQAMLFEPGAGLVRTFTLSNPLGASANNISSTVLSPTSGAFGHDNIRYIVGQNPANAAQGIVARMAATTSGTIVNSAFLTFGTGQLTSPIAVQTVLAPEPGTMAALGLGLAALLRMRRRK